MKPIFSLLLLTVVVSCSEPASNADSDVIFSPEHPVASDTTAIRSNPDEFAQENIDDQKAQFEKFLNGCYALNFPVTCESVFNGDSLPLPAFDLLDKFVVTSQIDGLHLPEKVAHEWWVSEDFSLLGKAEFENYYLVFVDYDWDDGHSVYSGVFFMSYTKDGNFISIHDLCTSMDVEKSGMIAFNSSNGTVNKDGSFKEVFRHEWQDNSGDELGPVNYSTTIYNRMFDASGIISEISTEELEGEAAKSAH